MFFTFFLIEMREPVASASFLLLRYKEAGHDLDVELEKIHEKSGQLVKCPICGSYDVAPILYGMPAYDEELEAREKNTMSFSAAVRLKKTQQHTTAISAKKELPRLQFLTANMAKKISGIL